MTNLAYHLTTEKQLIREFKQFKLDVMPKVEGSLILAIIVQPSLLEEIRANQM